MKYANPLDYGCVCKAYNFDFVWKLYITKWAYMICIYQRSNYGAPWFNATVFRICKCIS